MLELCRKVVEMIKAYPRLLLPLVASTYTYWWFERLQRFLFYTVVDWASTANSVMGFQTTTQDLSNPSVRRALLMLVPVSLLLRLFSFSIYVATFVFTASLAKNMVIGKEPDWVTALRDVQSRSIRVGLFALAIFLSHLP